MEQQQEILLEFDNMPSKKNSKIEKNIDYLEKSQKQIIAQQQEIDYKHDIMSKKSSSKKNKVPSKKEMSLKKTNEMEKNMDDLEKSQNDILEQQRGILSKLDNILNNKKKVADCDPNIGNVLVIIKNNGEDEYDYQYKAIHTKEELLEEKIADHESCYENMEIVLTAYYPPIGTNLWKKAKKRLTKGGNEKILLGECGGFDLNENYDEDGLEKDIFKIYKKLRKANQNQ